MHRQENKSPLLDHQYEQSLLYTFDNHLNKPKYIQIFCFYEIHKLQINLKDELEYLIENLAAITWAIKTKQPKEFFEKLIAKSKEVNKGSEGNYEYTINQLEKIKADNNR